MLYFMGENVIAEKSIRTNSRQLWCLKQKNLNPQNFSMRWEDWQHLVVSLRAGEQEQASKSRFALKPWHPSALTVPHNGAAQ